MFLLQESGYFLLHGVHYYSWWNVQFPMLLIVYSTLSSFHLCYSSLFLPSASPPWKIFLKNPTTLHQRNFLSIENTQVMLDLMAVFVLLNPEAIFSFLKLLAMLFKKFRNFWIYPATGWEGLIKFTIAFLRHSIWNKFGPYWGEWICLLQGLRKEYGGLMLETNQPRVCMDVCKWKCAITDPCNMYSPMLEYT